MSEPELLKRFQCGCQLSLRPVTVPDWDTSELPSLCFESRALRDTVGKAEVGSSGQWEGSDEVERSEVSRVARGHVQPLPLFSYSPWHRSTYTYAHGGLLASPVPTDSPFPHMYKYSL